jgi:hypothetical protein
VENKGKMDDPLGSTREGQIIYTLVVMLGRRQMIIIYPAGKIKNYIKLGRYPHLEMPHVCPTCLKRHTLVRIGYYKRWACTEIGESRLHIGRVFCKNCKTSHALLPAFLLPRRQCTARVIAVFLQQRIFKGHTLEKAMEVATKSHPSRQKGASWLKSMESKLLKIQHYVATLFPRFNNYTGQSCKAKPNALQLLLEMMFSGSKDVGSAFSFHSYNFHRMTQESLI